MDGVRAHNVVVCHGTFSSSVVLPKYSRAWRLMNSISACRIRGRDKARNAVDGETQALLIRPQRIFSPLPIVDVEYRCIPSDDLSSLVQQWVVLDEQPSILTVPAAHSSLVLDGTSRDSQIALVARSLGILRMKYVAQTAVLTSSFVRPV